MRGRYVKLMLHAATAGEPETPSAMDAGLVLCDVLAGRPMRVSQRGDGRDGGGQGRAFYPGLIDHARGLAACLAPDGDEAAAEMRLDDHRARVWAETTNYGYRVALRAGKQPVADDGAMLAADVWDELAANVLRRATGRPASASDVLDKLVAAQDGRGAFLRFDGNAGDNPEPWWYHELVLLHAVTSHALLTGDAAALEGAKRAAAFHHAETQPDHATGQPWAVHTFLLDLETTPTADMLLLAAGVNGAGGLSAVSRILLADAAICLSLV